MGIGLALLVVVVAGCAQATPTSSAGPRVSQLAPQAALTKIAADYRTACRSPGAAVGVRTPGGSNQFAVSGRSAPGLALMSNNQFLAGSVTKLYVATVALQLVAEHKLSLNDTVDQYLPGWPRGGRITIAMLLGHRSGMGDFGNDFSQQQSQLVLSNLTESSPTTRYSTWFGRWPL